MSLIEIHVEQVGEYAAEDADITWQLSEKLRPLLENRGQSNVFYNIEMPTIFALAAMECEGIAIDVEMLSAFSDRLAESIAELENRVYELAGEHFNLNSPKQLGIILYEKLNLVEKPKKTRTGQYSTNEQVLRDLAREHEIVRTLLDYREAAKLKSTYVDALPESRHASDQRVHTHYLQTGAATGRLASNDPNLQNIPVRTDLGREIRRAFVPRGPGYKLLAADYSQIELRIMAAMSRDKGLLEAFEQGLDIHTATAARVYDVALASVEPEMRRKAKMVNFGIMYGITAFGLAQRLKSGGARRQTSSSSTSNNSPACTNLWRPPPQPVASEGMSRR